ncbi:MAG: AAA family ATPase, partial [Thermodesulfobacteriota bacterium]
MIITRLDIEGFGIFRDASAPDLSPGLNLFFGENEAGKTTLLSFIPVILFGFPDGRTNRPRYLPMNGGLHGGSLGILDESLGRITVARHAGKSRGPLEVLLENGGTGDERTLSRVLSGVSENLFRSAHAFSLSELASMEALTDADLRAAVAGASYGSGFLRLDKAAKALKT